jgi:hypothetical protein
MAGYSFREQAGMIFTYGRSSGRRRVAKRVYQEAFPDRKQPNHQSLAAAQRRLSHTPTVTLAVADRERSRVARTTELVGRVLEHDVEDPGISTRHFPVARTSVWWALHEQLLCN